MNEKQTLHKLKNPQNGICMVCCCKIEEEGGKKHRMLQWSEKKNAKPTHINMYPYVSLLYYNNDEKGWIVCVWVCSSRPSQNDPNKKNVYVWNEKSRKFEIRHTHTHMRARTHMHTDKFTKVSVVIISSDHYNIHISTHMYPVYFICASVYI